MSDVQFEGDTIASSQQADGSLIDQQPNMLVKMLIKSGVVKNKKAANNLLYAVIIICLLITLSVLFWPENTGVPKDLPLPDPDMNAAPM
jgi:hypothetical protein